MARTASGSPSRKRALTARATGARRLPAGIRLLHGSDAGVVGGWACMVVTATFYEFNLEAKTRGSSASMASR